MAVAATGIANTARAETSAGFDPAYFRFAPETLETPHVAWAKPMPDGAIKALAIVPMQTGRDLSELWQRMELDLEVVYIKPSLEIPEHLLGYPPNSAVHFNVPGFRHSEVLEQLHKALLRDKEYDLILLGNLEWQWFPADIRASILRRVRNGTGLMVGYMPTESTGDWQAVIDELEPDSLGSMDLPLSFIRDRVIGTWPAAKREKDTLLRGKLGEGRVAVLDWGRPETSSPAHYALGEHAVTPVWPLCDVTQYGWAYEVGCATAIRTIRWAANAEPDVMIHSASIPTNIESGESFSIDISLESRSARDAVLTIYSRDLLNRRHKLLAKKVILEKGNQDIQVESKIHLEGVHAVDVVLSGDGSPFDMAIVPVVVASVDRVQSLAVDQPQRDAGSQLTGSVVIELNADKGDLHVHVVDAEQRLLASYEQEVVGAGSHTVPWSVTPVQSASTFNRVVATLTVDGQLVSEQRGKAIVDRREATAEKYIASIWKDLPLDYLTGVYLDRFRELDIDVLYQPHFFAMDRAYLEARAWQGVAGGLDLAPYIWRDYAYAKADLRDLKREPCLSSTDYHEFAKNKLTAYTQLAAKFACPFGTLGDEPYLVHYWNGVNGRDVCFGEACVASFQGYSQKRYGTLARLNEVWGTDFADWSDVMPEIYQDAAERGNFSRWIDHRLHMTGVFQSMLEREAEATLAVDPRMKVGIEGAYSWSPYKGYDFERLSRSSSFFSPYGVAHGIDYKLQAHQTAAFTPADKRVRRGGIVGWYNTFPRTAPYAEYAVWAGALQRQNTMLYYSGNTTWTMTGFGPDYQPLDFFSSSMDVVRELKDGIWNVLDRARFSSAQVAVLHSEASLMASFAQDPTIQTSIGRKQMIQWMLLLSDMGLSTTWLATPHVEAGALRSDIKVLVLPMAMVLSQNEVEEIRAFVQRGGILVADAVPSVLGPHGQPLKSGGMLDDVFGVTHKTWRLTDLRDSKQQEFPAERVGQIKLNGATAKYACDGVPLLTSHIFGNGRAILLNTTMNNYREARKLASSSPLSDELGAMLAILGVRDRFRVQDASGKMRPRIEVTHYLGDSVEYLAVVKDPCELGTKQEPYKLTLPEPRFVYKMRTGEALGQVSELKGLAESSPAMYALLPYEVTGVEVKLPELKIVRGQNVTFSAIVRGASDGNNDHVLRFEFVSLADPRKSYHRVVSCESGQASSTIELALNDPVGEWDLHVTDVLTGYSNKVTVNVH